MEEIEAVRAELEKHGLNEEEVSTSSKSLL
jgi:hypothetical protein